MLSREKTVEERAADEAVGSEGNGAARSAAIAAQVPAVTKAVAIVRRLNAASRIGLPLSEIAAELGITKSHCHNILKTLVAEGWVSFDAGRRRYALASRLLTDASMLFGRHDRSAIIHDELVRLLVEAQVPCVLTRIDRDGSFVAIDKAEKAGELIVSVPIGHRFPPDAPAQMRARLAFCDDAVREAAIRSWKPVRYTPATIVKKSQLRRELEATAERGYAISREEYSAGVMSLAAPIYSTFGEVQMILQCPGLAAVVGPREQEISSALLRTAERINVMYRGDQLPSM
ncbi:MAG: IclR family transcriptional regulator [bacterium]